jgi:hypothetical protein
VTPAGVPSTNNATLTIVAPGGGTTCNVAVADPTAVANRRGVTN